MRRAAVISIANFVGFQVNWFACALGAAAGRPWLGPVVVGVLATAHVLSSPRRRHEVLLLASAAGLGYVADSVLVLGGVLDVPAAARLGGPSPLWMVAMWVNLAATLHVSMRWLAGRYMLAALLGVVSGPLAYAAGARLGAIVLGSPAWWSLTLVGMEWLVAMPVLVGLAAMTSPAGARASGAAPAPGIAEARP